MYRVLLVVFSVLIVGCGMSDEKREEIADLTCSIMGETRNMDAAIRVREINSAREKLGEPSYVGGDFGIKESFKWGLCKELVLNDPSYEDLKSAMIEFEREERERKKLERIAFDNAIDSQLPKIIERFSLVCPIGYGNAAMKYRKALRDLGDRPLPSDIVSPVHVELTMLHFINEFNSRCSVEEARRERNL